MNRTIPLNLVLTGLLALAAPTMLRAEWKADPLADDSAHAAALAVPRAEMLVSMRASLFPSPATPPAPGYEVLSKTDEGDHERWQVRYTVDEGETAPAWLLVPKGVSPGARLPLLLALHATGGGLGKDRTVGLHGEPTDDPALRRARENQQYGLDAVRRGYVVFAPDREAWGERRTPPSDGRPLVAKELQAKMDEATNRLRERRPGWTLFAKQLWDMQRALDFLVTLEFVDPERIASMGLSLGAWDSVVLGALDERVRAIVVSHCGSLRFRPELWSDEAALRAYLAGNATRPQAINTNLNVYLMLLAPRSQLFCWSIEDKRDVPPNLVEALRLVSTYNRRVAKTAGKPLDFSFYLHPEGHDFSADSRALAWEWLAMRLKK